MNSTVFKWAAILGLTGFACGFFGPMLLSPQSNQGPMLGLFITGPGGLLAGAILGLVMAFSKPRAEVEHRLLNGFASVMGLGTLIAATPPPELMGRIIEAEIADCMAPAHVLPGAIAEWQKSIDQLPRAQPRAGWHDEAARAAQADTGVVLTMRISRMLLVYENRKPWNYGKVVTQQWRTSPQTYTYYARTTAGGCANFAKVKRDVYFPVSEREPEQHWPPKTLPNLLRMQVLGPVPDKYQALLD